MDVWLTISGLLRMDRTLLRMYWALLRTNTALSKTNFSLALLLTLEVARVRVSCVLRSWVCDSKYRALLRMNKARGMFFAFLFALKVVRVWISSALILRECDPQIRALLRIIRALLLLSVSTVYTLTNYRVSSELTWWVCDLQYKASVRMNQSLLRMNINHLLLYVHQVLLVREYLPHIDLGCITGTHVQHAHTNTLKTNPWD